MPNGIDGLPPRGFRSDSSVSSLSFRLHAIKAHPGFIYAEREPAEITTSRLVRGTSTVCQMPTTSASIPSRWTKNIIADGSVHVLGWKQQVAGASDRDIMLAAIGHQVHPCVEYASHQGPLNIADLRHHTQLHEMVDIFELATNEIVEFHLSDYRLQGWLLNRQHPTGGFVLSPQMLCIHLWRPKEGFVALGGTDA